MGLDRNSVTVWQKSLSLIPVQKFTAILLVFSDLQIWGNLPTSCVLTLSWLTISWRLSRWVSMQTRLVRRVSSFFSASAQCACWVRILWWARSSSPCTFSSNRCSSLSQRLLTRLNLWIISSLVALAVFWQGIKWGIRSWQSQSHKQDSTYGLSRNDASNDWQCLPWTE